MNDDRDNVGRPTRRAIIPPPHGWEPSTYYAAEVSFGSGNPIHKAVLYSGFIRDDKPSSYAAVWSGSYERPYKLDEVYYVKVLYKTFSD